MHDEIGGLSVASIHTTLLTIPAICYFLDACLAGYLRDYPMVIAFGCYGLANFGLIWGMVYGRM